MVRHSIEFNVSSRIYIEHMKKKSENAESTNPVFIEVSKPVSSMSAAEKEEFIEEILNAIERQVK